MPSGFVYILASKRNGTLYIGVTSDLHDRILEMQGGQPRRAKRPVLLLRMLQDQ